MKSWNEITKEMEAHRELHDKVATVAVGDKVEAPRHGRGTVLAVVGDNAWVQTPVRDYPLTFDVKKLKKVSPPRQGILCIVSEEFGEFDYRGSRGRKYGTVNWNVKAVELTDEVRERIKDLL